MIPRSLTAQNSFEDQPDVTTNTDTLLSISDVVQLFYPYVEMTDRFKRLLFSQSYLNYFMVNYEKLFAGESPMCEGKNENGNGTEKKLSKFFGNRKSAKNSKNNS